MRRPLAMPVTSRMFATMNWMLKGFLADQLGLEGADAPGPSPAPAPPAPDRYVPPQRKPPPMRGRLMSTDP